MGGHSGTPPPCWRGGSGGARRAPSAATGAFLGVGFCRTERFQLLGLRLSIPSSLAPVKVQQPPRPRPQGQLHQPLPPTFLALRHAQDHVCPERLVHRSPGESRCSPCGDEAPLHERIWPIAVTRNRSGGDSVSLQEAAVPPDWHFSLIGFHIAAVQLHWDK